MILNKKGNSNFYEPVLIVPPGETLEEILQERNITQVEFAKRVGKHAKTINEIIKGNAVITPETSLEFEQVLGIPAYFWNNLEARYQEMKARKELGDGQLLFIDEAKKYPYKEMVEHGWVPPAANPKEQVPHLLSFFAVTDFKNIIEKGAYRISSKHTYSMPAIMAWLRKGSVDSLKVETKDFDKEKLISCLPALKFLTKETDPNKMMEGIKTLLADCGVAFVLTQSLKNAPINGVTRWLSPNKVLLQLSLRYKYADIFWFSLFHEIGHILHDNKKDFNIDLINNPVEIEKEKRADIFACDVLIPPEIYAKFKLHIKTNFLSGISLYNAISRFADQINIHRGIVSGRLQHDHILPMNMNKLRSRLDWA